MIGIVTGLQSEAKLAKGLSSAIVSGGGHPGATTRKIEALIAQGVTGLVSFGIAGGLDPALPAGALVFSATVIDAAGKRYVGDPDWLQKALTIMPQAAAGHVYASDRIVETTAEKQALFQNQQVLSADMESHHVARAAEARGLRFLIIRAIADTASDVLPAAFGKGVDEDGGTRVLPIILALMTGELTLPAVLRAGQSANLALKNLSQARSVLQAIQ